ncbi:hypothetical protein ES703_09231 [subsurface metagenome]
MQIAGFDIVRLVGATVALLSTYVVAKVVSRALAKTFEKTPFSEQIERAIVRVSKYVVYVVGLFVVLSILGVDLTPVIIGLGVFSIAISFATRDIIRNFVSGIIVRGDKPFRIGDRIKIRGYEGRVVKIRIRTTVIEAENGDAICIPNSLFITNPLVVKRKGKKS